jgi:hypothetical protein
VNLNPALFSISKDGESFCCLYVVEDKSLFGSSITAIGILLSPITLPCESVGGPGKSNLLLNFVVG